MALTTSQKAKLRIYLLERFGQDTMAAVNELWIALFETPAQQKIRVQAWITAVRARRVTDKAGADAANTANKATFDAEVAELDTINSAL